MCVRMMGIMRTSLRLVDEKTARIIGSGSRTGKGFAGGLPSSFCYLADVVAYFQRGDGLALPLAKGGQDVVFQVVS